MLAELLHSGHLDQASFATLWRANIAASVGGHVEDVQEEKEEEEEDTGRLWSAAEQASLRRHVEEWQWGGYPKSKATGRTIGSPSAAVSKSISHWQRLTASIAAECGTQQRPILSAYSKACIIRKGRRPGGWV